MNITLTVREKNAIISLRKQGVPANVIAKAFHITVASVAAYMAWDTMRSNNGVRSR